MRHLSVEFRKLCHQSASRALDDKTSRGYLAFFRAFSTASAPDRFSEVTNLVAGDRLLVLIASRDHVDAYFVVLDIVDRRRSRPGFHTTASFSSRTHIALDRCRRVLRVSPCPWGVVQSRGTLWRGPRIDGNR